MAASRPCYPRKPSLLNEVRKENLKTILKKWLFLESLCFSPLAIEGVLI